VAECRVTKKKRASERGDFVRSGTPRNMALMLETREGFMGSSPKGVNAIAGTMVE